MYGNLGSNGQNVETVIIAGTYYVERDGRVSVTLGGGVRARENYKSIADDDSFPRCPVDACHSFADKANTCRAG